MDENLHNIENLFRSTLDDNEETPSPDVWEAVDKLLDKEKIISLKREYTNLKRIAIMLVLLFASFALYNVYRSNSNQPNSGFVKNNDTIDSRIQSKSGKVPDDISGNKDESISSEKVGKNNTLVADTRKDVPVNVSIEDESLTVKQKVKPTSLFLEKQNISRVTNSEKDITKNQIVITSSHKKKSAISSSLKIKIKNTMPENEGELLVQGNDEQQDKEIPTLRKLKNSSIDNVKLLPHDSIETIKTNLPVAVSIPQISSTVTNTVAKQVKNKVSRSLGFSVTPFFSPDIAWYRLQDEKDGNQQDNAREIEKEEQHEFSFAYGALVDYKINEHWGLQSGLTFLNTNLTVEPKTIYAQQDNAGSVTYRINTSSGYGYLLPSFSNTPSVGDSLYAFTSTHSLKYIGIPLAATYNVTKGKFKLNALAGLSGNILTKAILETTLEKGFNNSMEKVDKMQGLRKMYFSGLAGVGINYKLTNMTAITFSPTMRFALNSINKDATVKSYPMSFGFVAGLKLDL